MKTTDTVLDQIVAAKKQRVRQAKLAKPQSALEQEVASLPADTTISFYEALKADQPGPKLIAEIKKASPSSGLLRPDFSLEQINQAYQAAENVVAISVITEEDHFQGSDASLSYVASNNRGNKPLLRKDFIFDSYQVLESKLLGAHAYLLIVSLFTQDELTALIQLGQSINIEPLVEVHDQTELDMVLQTTARCIGVNCRDLQTFSIDHARHDLLRQLGNNYARIAESAIDTPEYLSQVSSFSDAALVGSHFMKSENIAQAIDELVSNVPAKGNKS